MDIKDEILLKLKNALNSKDSYIKYLQKLLIEHDVDYLDFLLFANHIESNYLKNNNDETSSDELPTHNNQPQKHAYHQNRSLESETSANQTPHHPIEQIKSHSQSFSSQPNQFHQRIFLPKITSELINRFVSYFHGREDVYANRAGKINPKTGKYGYYPKCANFFKQGLCLKTLKGNNNSSLGLYSQTHHYAADVPAIPPSSFLSCDDNYDSNFSESFSERSQDMNQLNKNKTSKDNSQKFSCAQCRFRKFVPLSSKAVYEHFLGMKINCSDVIWVVS